MGSGESSDSDHERLSSLVDFFEGLGFVGRKKPVIKSIEDWEPFYGAIEELEMISNSGVLNGDSDYDLDLRCCQTFANASLIAGNNELALEFLGRAIEISEGDSGLEETLGYLYMEISAVFSSNEEYAKSKDYARKSEEIRKKILNEEIAEREAKEIAEREAKEIAERERRLAEDRRIAADRLAKAKEEARVERERRLAEDTEVGRKEDSSTSAMRKWNKGMDEAEGSVERVLDIYNGTTFLLAIIAILGLFGVVLSDSSLESMFSIQIFCSAIFSYFSLTYFFHMWKNISINTSLSSRIQYERYALEISEEE